MEMMIVLLIVAIIAAASAPIVTKKLAARNAGTNDSPWVFTGINNSIGFNVTGNQNVAAIIGAADVNRAANQPIPKLYIESTGNEPQLGFGTRGRAGYTSLLMDRNNNRAAFSDSAAIPAANVVAMGVGQTFTGGNSVAVGVSTTVADRSTAIGVNTIASGRGSTALGINTQALQRSCLAIGACSDPDGFTKAEEQYSTAIGNFTNASGSYSTAIGSIAITSGTNAVAIGYNTRATMMNSIAGGSTAVATGENSVAFGSSVRASKINSVAIGSRAIATGENSIAIGNNDTTASHTNSVAIGRNATTTEANQIVLGDAGTTVYIRGRLVVGGKSYLGVGGSNDSHVWAQVANGSGHGWFIDGDKGIAFGGRQEHGLGSAYSDRRLKNVGEKYTAGLAELKKLDFFNFTFKKDEAKIPHVGVMAQDLQKVFPDAVTKGKDGYLRIRWEDMFYAVINAVKELDNKITEIVKNITDINSTIEKQNQTIAEQQKVIEVLQKQNEEFEKRLKKLEK